MAFISAPQSTVNEGAAKIGKSSKLRHILFCRIEKQAAKPTQIRLLQDIVNHFAKALTTL